MHSFSGRKGQSLSTGIKKKRAGAVQVAFVMAIFVLLLQRQRIKKVYERGVE